MYDAAVDEDGNNGTHKRSRMRFEANRKHTVTLKDSFVQLTPTAQQIEAIQSLVARIHQALLALVDRQPQADNSGLSQSMGLQVYEADSVTLSNLAAIQPNLHNDDDYLPLHLDNPRHDGFGIVIVTIALAGPPSDVVIVDDGDIDTPTSEADNRADNGDDGSDAAHGTDTAAGICADTCNSSSSRSWVFTLHPGEFYVLSGYSRNKCAHGVKVQVLPGVTTKTNTGTSTNPTNPTPSITTTTTTTNVAAATANTTTSLASDTIHSSSSSSSSSTNGNITGSRVSLNLRFGVHTAEQAWHDIDRHWG